MRPDFEASESAWDHVIGNLKALGLDAILEVVIPDAVNLDAAILDAVPRDGLGLGPYVYKFNEV